MIYAVSDIHGHYYEFLDLLEKINFSDEDTMYVLGDMADRGEYVASVMKCVLYRDNIIPLMGNHDREALQILGIEYGFYPNEDGFISKERMRELKDAWFRNGGKPTWDGFREIQKDISRLDCAELIYRLSRIDYFREITVGDRRFFLSHTVPGVDRFSERHNLSGEDYVFGIPDYDVEYEKGLTIVTGHTPTSCMDPDYSGKIWKGNGHIAIDCGAGYEERLGCICLDDLSEYYVDICPKIYDMSPQRCFDTKKTEDGWLWGIRNRDDNGYFVNEPYGVILRYLGLRQSAGVPAEIDGIKIKEIYSEAFRNCITLTDVRLPEGILYVNDRAFSGCVNLKEVVLPDSVVYIGPGAFADCESLLSINIPDKVTAVEIHAFENCTSLKEVHLSPNTSYIGTFAFCGCRSLESIVIPENVESINVMCFAGCSSLQDVIFPGNLVEIDISAFAGCANLRDIDLPPELETIESKAFCSCIRLRNVYVFGRVNKIDDSAFAFCPVVSFHTGAGTYAEKWAAVKGIPVETDEL